jgi:hypothetical protein
MHTLNIYNQKTGAYLFSITQNTRKQCLAIANEKYSDLGWDWDDKNYVKNKKYNYDRSTTVSVYGLI